MGAVAADMNEDDFQEILRVQQMMAQRIMQEQQTDHKIDVLNIVNDLTENGRKRAQTEAVILEAQAEGILEREVLRLLDDLVTDNLIRRTTGFVERI